jgi:hypothetical protein
VVLATGIGVRSLRYSPGPGLEAEVWLPDFAALDGVLGAFAAAGLVAQIQQSQGLPDGARVVLRLRPADPGERP